MVSNWWSLGLLCNVSDNASEVGYIWSAGALNICVEFGLLFVVLCIFLVATVLSCSTGCTIVLLSRLLWFSFVLKAAVSIIIVIICTAVMSLYFCTHLLSRLYPLHIVEYGFVGLVLALHALFWVSSSLKRPISPVSIGKFIDFVWILVVLCLILISYQRYVIYGLHVELWLQLLLCLCSVLYLFLALIDCCVDGNSERANLLQQTQYITARPHITVGSGDYNKSCLSQLLFAWTTPLLVKGRRGQLHNCNDVFKLPPALSIHNVTQHVHANMGSTIPTISLASVLLKCFGFEYFSLGILKFFGDNLVFAGPILLNLLVNFIENKSEPITNGYIYAGVMCGCSLLSAMFGLHFNYRINRVGLKLRAYLIPLIYEKLVSVSQADLSPHFSCGGLMNLMSTDTERVVNFCPSFHSLWSLPVQLVIALYLLYREVDENGKITRLRRECNSESCGGGVFMAAHFDRQYCGKCYSTLVHSDPKEREKVAKGKK